MATENLTLSDRLTEIERRLVNLKAFVETAAPALTSLVEKVADGALATEAFNVQILVEQASQQCKQALDLVDFAARYSLAEQPETKLNLYDPQTGKPTLNNPARNDAARGELERALATVRAALDQYRADHRSAPIRDLEVAGLLRGFGNFLAGIEDEPAETDELDLVKIRNIVQGIAYLTFDARHQVDDPGIVLEVVHREAGIAVSMFAEWEERQP